MRAPRATAQELARARAYIEGGGDKNYWSPSPGLWRTLMAPLDLPLVRSAYAGELDELVGFTWLDSLPKCPPVFDRGCLPMLRTLARLQWDEDVRTFYGAQRLPQPPTVIDLGEYRRAR